MRRVFSILAVLLSPVAAAAQTACNGGAQVCDPPAPPAPPVVIVPPPPPATAPVVPPPTPVVVPPSAPPAPPAPLPPGSSAALAPGGRLTLQSGYPVMASDAISTVLYYTPFRSGSLAGELAISLAGQPAGAIRDVYLNGATLCLTSWHGAPCGAPYLGSVLIDPVGGQASCTISYGQDRWCGIWNADHRRRICLLAGDNHGPDPTTGRFYYNPAYGPNNWGPANGDLLNRATVFMGRAEDEVEVTYAQAFFMNSYSYGVTMISEAIGWNQTIVPYSAASAFPVGKWGSSNYDLANMEVGGVNTASYVAPPFEGVAVVTMLEVARGNFTGIQAFHGQKNQELRACYWY